MFLYMPDSMVKELIPTIGKRYCFLEKRKTLIQDKEEKLLVRKVIDNFCCL